MLTEHRADRPSHRGSASKWVPSIGTVTLLCLAGLLALAPAESFAQRESRQSQAAAWVLPRVEGPNLRWGTFSSKAAGQSVSYVVFLPPGYEASKDTRFPVVYWLHGLGGDHRGAVALARTFASGIASGKCPPMLVVFVNGMRDSMWVDSKDGKTPVETVLVKDLIPHIDSTYRTRAYREGRMIEGFSMGGFGAIRLGFRHVDLFGSVSSLGGALHSETTLQSRRRNVFDKVFGGDAEYFRQQSPWTLAERNASDIKAQTIVRLAVGDQDGTQEYNRDFTAHLNKLGISHEYHLLPGVGHSWGPIYQALGDKNWGFYSRAFARSK